MEVPTSKQPLPEPCAQSCCSTKIKAGPHSSAVIRLQLLYAMVWPGESASPTHLDWHPITAGLVLLCRRNHSLPLLFFFFFVCEPVIWGKRGLSQQTILALNCLEWLVRSSVFSAAGSALDVAGLHKSASCRQLVAQHWLSIRRFVELKQNGG